MPDPSPSSRLLGTYAKFYLGSTDGGSDYYATADCAEWAADVARKVVDVSANDDLWDVNKPATLSAKFRGKRFVATQKFMALLIDHPCIYVDGFRGGDASAGGTVIKGVLVLDQASIEGLRRGEATMENISGVFTGAVTVAAS